MKQVAKLLAFWVIASFPAAADTLNFSFANVAATNIVFTGHGSSADFQMTTKNVGGHAVGFQITDSALIGLYGSVQGDYQYSTVVGTTVQTAAVSLKSGIAKFTLWDASGFDLTADVAWVDIFTIGTTGGLNAGGSVNLSNFQYAGSNATLLSLANGTDGMLTASFQFVPAKSLTTLKTNGKTNRTSYSGTVSATVPDGGMTLILLGGALLGIETLRRKLRV